MKTSNLQILFISFITICSGGFLSGCKNSTHEVNGVAKTPLSSPPPEAPSDPTEVAPSKTTNDVPLQEATHCVGENFIGDDAVDEIDETIEPNEFSKILEPKILSTEGADLETAIEVRGQKATIELRNLNSKKNLYTISQEPFNGFIQGSLTKSNSGGWLQCESDDGPLNELTVKPKFCNGHWYDKTMVLNKDIGFRLGDGLADSTLAYSHESFDIFYELSDHFIIVTLMEPNTDIEIASGLVDRYFKTASMNFFLQTVHVWLECNEEVQ